MLCDCVLTMELVCSVAHPCNLDWAFTDACYHMVCSWHAGRIEEGDYMYSQALG